MLQGNAQHHNMAVDDLVRADPMEEVEGDKSGKDAPNAQEDPYMTFHDAQEAGRGSAPSQASGFEEEKLAEVASVKVRGDGSQSESSYQPRRETVRRVGPYGKTSKGKGQFPEGLPKGLLWADQEEDEWEEDGDGQPSGKKAEGDAKVKKGDWRAEHERVRKGWFQNQPQEAAQALGAPTYTPATGTDQMFASMQAMLANLSAKMDDREKEWARAREEDKAAAAVQQIQSAAYIEEAGSEDGRSETSRQCGEYDCLC